MELTDKHIHDAVAIRDNAKEIFIAARAVEEQRFTNWYNSLLKCSKEKVLDRIPFDYELESITFVGESTAFQTLSMFMRQNGYTPTDKSLVRNAIQSPEDIDFLITIYKEGTHGIDG